MLIEFSVGNFRSFYTPVTLSMLASKLRESDALDRDAVFHAGRWSLLRSAAVFGANASGKSNLIRALSFMKRFVLDSATRLQVGDSTRVSRFALFPQAKQEPAMFQIVFMVEGVQYRYGFELDEQRVRSEWLYRTVQREARMFVREDDEFDIAVSLRKEARGVERLTRENALFLSVLAQFNSATAGSILQWFRDKLGVISGISDENYLPYTLQRIEEDKQFQDRVRALIRLADVGITDVWIETIPFQDDAVPAKLRLLFEKLAELEDDSVPEALKRAKMTHPLFENGLPAGKIDFDIDEESAGTQKFLALLGPVIDTLERGGILAIDEFEASLHPLLTRELVRLFNSPIANAHQAQFIFATHDVELLSEQLLRRDQIWFTEKSRYGETELYSLAEMKERKDASYLKNYLLGRYGAVPYLGGLRSYLEQEFDYEQKTQAQRAKAA